MLCFGLLCIGPFPRLSSFSGYKTPGCTSPRPRSNIGLVRCAPRMGRRGGASAARGRPRRGDGRRPNRVGEVIRRELAAIIDDSFAQMKEFGGDSPVLVSVVDVRCSDDLRNARIGISVFGTDDQKKLALSWLKENRKLIRYELAACIRGMKYIPDLMFGESEVAQAVRAVNIIDKLAQERERKQSGLIGFEASTDAITDDDGLDLDAMAENPFEEDEDESHDDDSDDEDDESNEDYDDDMVDIEDVGSELENIPDSMFLSSVYKTIQEVEDTPGKQNSFGGINA